MDPDGRAVHCVPTRHRLHKASAAPRRLLCSAFGKFMVILALVAVSASWDSSGRAYAQVVPRETTTTDPTSGATAPTRTGSVTEVERIQAVLDLLGPQVGARESQDAAGALRSAQNEFDAARRALTDATTQLTKARTRMAKADQTRTVYLVNLYVSSGSRNEADVYTNQASDQQWVRQYMPTLFTSLNAEVESARGELDAAEARVSEARARMSSQGQMLAGASSRAALAQRSLNAASSSGWGGGATVLGSSLLNADDLVRFLNERHKVINATVDVHTLAQLFLDEGAAEGVRGDVAFVQSIVETGWFGFNSSMVAPSDNNFAGIGACDSCSSGFKFPDARTGVRYQMQLLRAYATPGLTTAMLANPPVRGTPETLSTRGCCVTWFDLGGKWASGAGYGEKILGLYTDMLSSALKTRGGDDGTALVTGPGLTRPA